MKKHLEHLCVLTLLFAWCSFSSEPTTKLEDNKDQPSTEKASSPRATSRKNRQRPQTSSDNDPQPSDCSSGCKDCQNCKKKEIDPKNGK